MAPSALIVMQLANYFFLSFCFACPCRDHYPRYQSFLFVVGFVTFVTTIGFCFESDFFSCSCFPPRHPPSSLTPDSPHSRRCYLLPFGSFPSKIETTMMERMMMKIPLALVAMQVANYFFVSFCFACHRWDRYPRYLYLRFLFGDGFVIFVTTIGFCSDFYSSCCYYLLPLHLASSRT